jgi:hypothetical protein
MPRPPIDLPTKIMEIVDHVGDMPDEAEAPFAHYMLGANAAMNMRRYFMQVVDKTSHKPAVRNRHLVTLNNMVLVNLVESLERFFKEIAAVCVDHLSDRVFDNRFDDLSISGGFLVAHLAGSSAGRALCESDTWLNCRIINDRFARFLRHPVIQNDTIHVFPLGGMTSRIMGIVWQLRHTVVHNVGVVTRSDAAKLRVLAKKQVPSPRILLSVSDDLRFLRAYLDEQATDINQRVGERLALILTALHADNPALFIPQDEANAITRRFGFPLNVAGAMGVLPP